MQVTLPSDNTLLAAPAMPKAPASQMIVDVARNFNVSPFRQLREMVSLNWRQGKLAFHEYYTSGSFDPNLTTAQKREFTGEKGNYKLNKKLSPIRATRTREFIRDKVMYCSLLEQLGFRTTKTQAVASSSRSYGNIPALRCVEDIEDFLVNKAVFPIFGKPVEGYGSIGSVLISSIDREAGLLMLSNGKTIDIHELAVEVFESFNTGYIFQSAVDQHPDMRKMTGDVVGTLRVVTLRDENGIEPLYSVWKIPSPSAMSDNFWQAGSMVAEVDNATGKLVRCKHGAGMDAKWIDTHPVNSEAFSGYQIPHWEATKKLAIQTHELFPEFGVFGWDIAVTDDGPLIVECNENPAHALYQLSTGRGFLNEDFKQKLSAASDCSDQKFKAKINAFKNRNKTQN